MRPVHSIRVRSVRSHCEVGQAGWKRRAGLISGHQSVVVPGGTRVAQAVQTTIQFPYKRSLGPVVGAFMTAPDRPADHRDPQRRPGDRARRSSGIPTPPRSWRTTSSTSARPARSSRGRGWPRPTVAAPARPPVRVRADQARRRRHVAPARGRRRLDRRHEHRHAGRAPLARRAHRPHHRHRGVRARRGAGGARRRRRRRPRSRSR